MLEDIVTLTLHVAQLVTCTAVIAFAYIHLNVQLLDIHATTIATAVETCTAVLVAALTLLHVQMLEVHATTRATAVRQVIPCTAYMVAVLTFYSDAY